MGAVFVMSSQISPAARRWAPVGAKGRLAQKGARSAGIITALAFAAPRLRRSPRPNCRVNSSSNTSRRRAAWAAAMEAGRWMSRMACQRPGSLNRVRKSGGRNSSSGSASSSARATHRAICPLPRPSVWGYTAASGVFSTWAGVRTVGFAISRRVRVPRTRPSKKYSSPTRRLSAAKWVLNQVRVSAALSSPASTCTMVRPPGRRTAPRLEYTAAFTTVSASKGAAATGAGFE